MNKKPVKTIVNAIVIALLLAVVVWAYFWSRDNGAMSATIWALVPPLIAIVLALVTKEVYSSLFAGILVGSLFFANFDIELTYTTLVQDGFIGALSDAGHVGILIFLVVLGIFVVLMNRAGGSLAYGEWAQKNIKGRKGALLGTFGLGVLIFVDDYFNCLTVGSIMRPVTDKFNISRAKLAYLIDATAAPICMIAPISSWAAAVAGVLPGDADGFNLFIQAIPYNLYSLLTIAMIVIITLWGLDFGPMRKHEQNAMAGDLYTTPDRPYANAVEEKPSLHGKVLDLILPIVALIVLCVAGLIYTGYAYGDATNMIEAFANCDATVGLALGSIVALILTIIYYMARRLLSFQDCMSAFPEGFKAMVPAIMILTFAWTLCGITGMLESDVYVAGVFEGAANSLLNLLPVVVFLISIALSFSTGTSWGTFGILLPIVVGVGLEGNLLIMAISACLAGAVCGDHCSPISDTTIMASTGAQSNHINHVSTQLPYALLVAGVSAVGYILGGMVFQNAWLTLAASLVLLVAALFVIRLLQNKKAKAA